MPCPAGIMHTLFRRMWLHGKGCWQLFLVLLLLLLFFFVFLFFLMFLILQAVVRLHLSSQDQGGCCRHRVHKAGAVRGPEAAAPASRGGHPKASSSTGRAYTSSGGLAPQLPHTCHSCGVEMGGTSRYSRSHSYLPMGLLAALSIMLTPSLVLILAACRADRTMAVVYCL